MHTPGLWWHIFRPVQFILVVDDFDVKFCRCWATSASSVIIKEILWNCVGSNRNQILWNYAGIGLRKQNSWLKYAKLRTYKTKGVWPPQSIKTTTCATQRATTFSYSQKPVPIDYSPQLSKECTKRIQHIVRSILYSVRSIDLTIIKTLNTLVTQRSAPTENTNQRPWELS